jgi:hypothetical protein
MCFHYSAGTGGQLEVFGALPPPPFGGLGGVCNKPHQRIQKPAARHVRGGRLPRGESSPQGESAISISAVAANDQFSW